MGVATSFRAPEVESLIKLLSHRRPDVARHGVGVGHYARELAIELGFGEETASALEIAGKLHDLGTIAVPRHVLAKPGPLDELEWAEIHLHPGIGADLLHNRGMHKIAGWVLAHHERIAGNGYPRGLVGDEIPVEARVIAVVDAYLAMRSERPYRPALSRSKAIAEITNGAGSQFDGEIAELFLRSLS